MAATQNRKADVCRPRILVWFWASRGGGGSQFATFLARRLGARFGSGSVTLSLHGEDPTSELARSLGLNVLSAVVISDRKRPIATLASLTHAHAVLVEHIRTVNADIICIPMNFASAAPLSYSIRQPIVFFAHDPIPHPGDYSARMQRLTQGRLLRRANAVVALSAFGAERLKELDPSLQGRLYTLPLSAVFEPGKSVRRGFKPPTRMLFLGRALPYKGLDILADAMDALSERDDWLLTVAGHGEVLDAAMVARFGDPRIQVRTNWMTYAQTAELLDTHDVLIAPYRSASQSGVVSEALAAGMPVAATPVGALPEQIGQGRAGWLADSASPRALGAVLGKMLDDGDGRAQKAQAAQAMAREFWETDWWDWLEHVD